MFQRFDRTARDKVAWLGTKMPLGRPSAHYRRKALKAPVKPCARVNLGGKILRIIVGLIITWPQPDDFFYPTGDFPTFGIIFSEEMGSALNWQMRKQGGTLR